MASQLKKVNKSTVILGMSANALSVARSLGRKGIPVIGVDNSTDGPAVLSRYVRQFRLTPDLQIKAQLIEILKSIANEYTEKPVLFMTADEYVAFVSENREVLAQHFEFLLPSKKTIQDFLDKRKTAELCIKHIIKHPQTYFLEHDEQWSNVLDTINYPCIIKPQDSHVWRKYFDEQKAFVINSKTELVQKHQEIKKYALDVIVQQIIPGEDHAIYQFLAFCNKESEILASFVCHKLRQYPPHFGIACLCESSDHPLIIKAGREFLKKIPYKGMIALEFKIDQKTNQPVFMEANLRTSFFGELAVAAGVDFPHIIYQNLAYQDNSLRKEDYIKGLKLWNLDLDLGSLSRMRQQKTITFGVWFKGLWAKKIAHTYFALDDLRPWMNIYGKFIKVCWRKISGKHKLQAKIGSRKLNRKRKEIQVLHLISSVGLFGAENIVLSLGKNLLNSKYRLIVGAIHDPKQTKPAILQKAEELNLETMSLPCHGRFDGGAVGRLAGFIKEKGVDLIHTHNYKSDIIGSLAARKAGVPAVATAHGFTDMNHTVSVYERLDRWFLKHYFQKVVVVTKTMLNGFPSEKKCVVANGISTARFKRDPSKREKIRRQFQMQEMDFVIGTVGRLSHEKNQKMLLEAAYTILRENNQAKILIVGEGPEEKDLRQFVAARHLEERIIFTGLIRDISGVYPGMDCFVLPSITEGVPLTVLEAMASGVPVVATRVGGIPEIITHGKTGLLVDNQDVGALRESIKRIMTEKEIIPALTSAALDFVRANYSLEKMCAAYEAVYADLVAC